MWSRQREEALCGQEELCVVQLAVSSFTPTRACEKPDAKVRCWVRSEKQKQLLSFTNSEGSRDEILRFAQSLQKPAFELSCSVWRRLTLRSSTQRLEGRKYMSSASFLLELAYRYILSAEPPWAFGPSESRCFISCGPCTTTILSAARFLHCRAFSTFVPNHFSCS